MMSPTLLAAAVLAVTPWSAAYGPPPRSAPAPADPATFGAAYRWPAGSSLSARPSPFAPRPTVVVAQRPEADDPVPPTPPARHKRHRHRPGPGPRPDPPMPPPDDDNPARPPSPFVPDEPVPPAEPLVRDLRWVWLPREAVWALAYPKDERTWTVVIGTERPAAVAAPMAVAPAPVVSAVVPVPVIAPSPFVQPAFGFGGGCAGGACAAPSRGLFGGFR